MTNEFDKKGIRTKNFEKQKEIISEMSVYELMNMVIISEYAADVLKHDKRFEEAEELADAIGPVKTVLEKCKTDKKCPKCGKELYLSDLPQYDFLCFQCDENF